LVIGAVGELVIFDENMIGKWSVGEISKEMTVYSYQTRQDEDMRMPMSGNETC